MRYGEDVLCNMAPCPHAMVQWNPLVILRHIKSQAALIKADILTRLVSSPHSVSPGNKLCTRTGLGNRIWVIPTVALGSMGFSQEDTVLFTRTRRDSYATKTPSAENI